MTEEEWRASTDLVAMLKEVQTMVSRRKLLLVAVAGVRCCWGKINDDAKRDLTRMEAYMEGELDRKELTGRWPEELDNPAGAARWIIDWVVRYHLDTSPRQAELFRCVVGNPFRPCAVGPALLAWEDRMIPRLAGTIYAEQAWERLPILGDALEEASAPVSMIEHCRADGPHLRGCWVLDRLLARE
jgi:hypothetical protein